MEKAKVYFTKDISSNGLLKIHEALNCELKGKVAVKISTGEPGGHDFLNPSLIEPLVSKLKRKMAFSMLKEIKNIFQI